MPRPAYTWLGDDEPAAEHAREIIAYHSRPDGSSNAPMRTANSQIDLGTPRQLELQRPLDKARGGSAETCLPEPCATAL